MKRHSEPLAPWRGRARFLEGLCGEPLWRPFGESAQGRALVRASLGRGPAMLVIGAIHGDEPASGVVVARWIRDLAAQGLPRGSGRVVVVAVLNPDGFAAHRKDNGRGVDLNRNYPTRNFGESPRPGYDPGPRAASEPETRALLRLCARLRPTCVVAVHQPFECVNYDGPAAEWARSVAEACGYPARASIGYPTPGSMGTYFGVEREVPILTLELGREPPARAWPSAHAALDAALAHRPG